MVTMHHEQGVAFAADGATRFTGRPTSSLATAGPGATNTLTIIASAWFDSVPTIFLSGQVQSYLLKDDRPLRQFGLQECDLLPMAASVTKRAKRAATAAEVPALLDEALRVALEGRPGPVLIELPYDVQAMPDQADSRARRGVDYPGPDPVPAEALGELFDALAAAQRPVMLLGGGVRLAGAAERIRELRGCSAPRSPCRHDRPGRAARERSAAARRHRDVRRPLGEHAGSFEADVLLVLGSRLDHGVLGCRCGAVRRGGGPSSRWTATPARCSGSRACRRRRRPRRLRRRRAAAGPSAGYPADWQDWRAHVAELRARWPDTEELAGCRGINPNVLMRQLSAVSPAAAAFVVDEGQHLWWACQSMQPAEGQRFLAALGLAACGWSFPAAVGVAHATGRPWSCWCGDGAFQFNLQELQTRRPRTRAGEDRARGQRQPRQRAPAPGNSVRRPVHRNRPGLRLRLPDFVRLAQAYGIDSQSVAAPGDIGPTRCTGCGTMRRPPRCCGCRSTRTTAASRTCPSALRS